MTIIVNAMLGMGSMALTTQHSAAKRVNQDIINSRSAKIFVRHAHLIHTALKALHKNQPVSATQGFLDPMAVCAGPALLGSTNPARDRCHAQIVH